MSAFMDLDSSRPVGFGLAPIPWLTIHDYCDRLGLEEEQREDMHYHIDAMDTAFRKHHKKD